MITNLLIATGVAGAFISGILYLFWYGRLRRRLKTVDSTEFYKLGLDVGTELLGPTYGTREGQAFLFKKLYMKHLDKEAVELGHKTYGSMVFILVSMLLVIVGMVSNAVIGT